MRRRRGEEGRQEFLKSRRSGEWAHRFLFNIIVLFFSEDFCLVMGAHRFLFNSPIQAFCYGCMNFEVDCNVILERLGPRAYDKKPYIFQRLSLISLWTRLKV